MAGVTSNLYNLQSIIEADYSFNIPIYQRLYVWTDEQVKTLFEDIYSAWSNKKELYYIGSVITVPNEQQASLYDLVDGQQRFTTLWILANEMKGELLHFAYTGKTLRLKFSIRKNVETYFYNIEKKTDDVSKDARDFGDLINISKARKLLQILINENIRSKADRINFAQFILKKVTLVISQVPEKTDLNKLFETLNNRGEQLQQHEILKARLLKHIKNPKSRLHYGILWNLSSEMNEYLERVITKEIGSAKAVAAAYWEDKENKELGGGLILEDIFKLLDNKTHKKITSIDLKSILKAPNKFKNENEAYKRELDFYPATNDDEFEPVRSILTFSQLLLHTLRILLFNKNQKDIKRINEKELLKIFDENLLTAEFLDEVIVKEFIELVFLVREVFDKYIIKWVSINEEKEEHLIKTIHKRNQKKRSRYYYLRREKKEELNEFALLQSILYHSQQNTTQYWLTPLLCRLVNDEYYTTFEDAFKWLRMLDNTILSSGREDLSLSERTWNSFQDYLPYQPTLSVFQEVDRINVLGTHFPHYWFYKIEFVLWYFRKKLKKEKEWKDYKMTARNSIEHIGPQNPRYLEDKVCIEFLDTMGNLVLVTRSVNSEYSDMAFSRKKAIFLDKKSKGSLDSLKSDLIYDYKDWNDNNAKEHHEKILTLLEMYFDEHNTMLSTAKT